KLQVSSCKSIQSFIFPVIFNILYKLIDLSSQVFVLTNQFIYRFIGIMNIANHIKLIYSQNFSNLQPVTCNIINT
ncbi:MAG: hypothetical protein KAU83_02580, partial [Bacteroidales bacterium]|nr:hypothetical protein [Bacteroidales bacterium]